MSVDSRTALARNVAQAEIDGIQVQLRGQLVHGRLEGEERLGGAGGAVSVDGRLVGGHLIALDVEVGDAVGPGKEVARQARVPTRGRAVVVVVARPQHDELAILPSPELEVELGAGRRTADDELLRPRQAQADRPPQAKGEQRKQWLEKLDLAAEAAADRHRNNAHLVRRQIDERGHAVADDERSLRGGPDGEPAVGLGTHDRDMRLHERVMRARKPVGLSDHDVGLLQCALCVAAPEVGHAGDVARTLLWRIVSRRRGAVNRSVLVVGRLVFSEHER